MIMMRTLITPTSAPNTPELLSPLLPLSLTGTVFETFEVLEVIETEVLEVIETEVLEVVETAEVVGETIEAVEAL